MRTRRNSVDILCVLCKSVGENFYHREHKEKHKRILRNSMGFFYHRDHKEKHNRTLRNSVLFCAILCNSVGKIFTTETIKKNTTQRVLNLFPADLADKNADFFYGSPCYFFFVHLKVEYPDFHSIKLIL